LYSTEIGNSTTKNSVPSIIFETTKFKISASLNHAMAMYLARGFIKIPVIPKANAMYKNKSFFVNKYISRKPVVKTRLVSSVLILSITPLVFYLQINNLALEKVEFPFNTIK
jgi:hypothetical protein